MTVRAFFLVPTLLVVSQPIKVFHDILKSHFTIILSMKKNFILIVSTHQWVQGLTHVFPSFQSIIFVIFFVIVHFTIVCSCYCCHAVYVCVCGCVWVQLCSVSPSFLASASTHTPRSQMYASMHRSLHVELAHSSRA